MKQFILAFFILISISVTAQELDTISIADSIVLQFDSIPRTSFFNGDTINSVISRIASLKEHDNINDISFLLFIIYSVLLSLIFINSKTIVSSSFKTLFNIQYALQFYRTEKKRNTLYYLIYLSFFIIGFSFLLYTAYNQISVNNTSYLKVIIFTTSYFLIDYGSSYIYLLFTKNNKAIEIIQTSILSFSVILSVFLWPLLVFVIVGKLFVSLFVIIFSIVVVAFFLLMKELRVLQILNNEKVDILSFHFFTYLCTFKFLPIIILIKVFFN